jgi:thymidylate synthase (FAD)
MVKLVSVTQAVGIVEPGSEEVEPGSEQFPAENLVVYVARVSNPANQFNFQTSERLLAYMIENRHWSPFEMADMTVEIKTSRAIAQQILRHRSFSFQEFSQRYSEVSEIEPVELRKGGTKNRQSSIEVFDPENAAELIENHFKESQNLYKKLIKLGVARECARFVMPLATKTTLYMKGSLRSWIHYLQIRTEEHTQKEHREIAKQIAQIFKSQFPIISKYLQL